MDREERSNDATISTILDRMNNVLRDIETHTTNRTLNAAEAASDISSIIRNLVRIGGNLLLDDEDDSNALKATIESLRSLKLALETGDDTSASEQSGADYRVPSQGRVGQPKLAIDIVKLKRLIQMGYSLSTIARTGLLGVKMHRNTLSNHLKRNDVNRKDLFDTITDEELSHYIRDYNALHPNSGSDEILASLLSHGIKVQREKVREMLASADPLGTASRWSKTVQRRKYSVPNSNSVWHVDTHHSLKRWGIFVHGGIDGFSRLVSYLRAASCNTAKAALCLFVKAVRQYGVPSRVRADSGTEFVDVGRFMERVNGTGRGSIMKGKSVHNQRIERLWRDVYQKVLQLFYRLFYHMEESGILDVNNPVHMFCLQLVFIPRIDDALQKWSLTHNNHKLRTEHYKTPEQLWLESLILRSQEETNNTAVANALQPPEEAINNAVVEICDGTTLEEQTYVDTPRFPLPIIRDSLTLLQQTIDVRRISDCDGIDIYAEVLDFVRAHQQH